MQLFNQCCIKILIFLVALSPSVYIPWMQPRSQAPPSFPQYGKAVDSFWFFFHAQGGLGNETTLDVVCSYAAKWNKSNTRQLMARVLCAVQPLLGVFSAKFGGMASFGCTSEHFARKFFTVWQLPWLHKLLHCLQVWSAEDSLWLQNYFWLNYILCTQVISILWLKKSQ